MEENIFSGPAFSQKVREIIDMLWQESDKGCVLVASSMIEEGLLELISSFLLPPTNSKDELFHGPAAPFSSLESRIAMAYRLGLITKSVAKSLGVFRKLRNEFAHRIETVNFDSPSALNRLNEIYRLFPELSDYLDDIGKRTDNHPLPMRLKFIMFFSSNIAAIKVVKTEVVPITPLEETKI